MMSKNLMNIRVYKTSDGWMVECNGEDVYDGNDNNTWDNIVDALDAMKDQIQAQKEFYVKYGVAV